MKIEINLNYLASLYDYLYFMDDEEIMNFHINSENDQNILFSRMRELYQSFGNQTQNNILNAMSYLLINHNYLDFWRYVVPHDIPLEDVEDKERYLKSMYSNLFGNINMELNMNDFDVQNNEILTSSLKL
ncbi:hypothetical protein G9F31_15250 [Acinetobacter sp. 187]|uniref:hypothetical protein n=1 Tax=Acinetobacter lanii TaxID=2715163 RepID=UPI00140CA938|nr:hypothetical protein [Acinetobacter lanii]NHC05084.1 hypothetical protein [Acinetobacter lanii]